MKTLISCVLFTYLGSATLNYADQTFTSGVQPPTLIELFSSEGCSSCPPAEAWLNSLVDKQGLWTAFIPVGFHVDYWDHLGWKDPFARSSYTDRQYRYSALAGSTSVYTPEFVANGLEWRDWSSGLIPSNTNPNHGGKLEVRLHDWAATVTYTGTTSTPSNLQTNVVLLGFDRESKVRAGENSGSTLPYHFVALSLQQPNMVANESSTVWSGSVNLPKVNDPGRIAMAAWVEDENTAQTLQAVGGWIRGANSPVESTNPSKP